MGRAGSTDETGSEGIVRVEPHFISSHFSDYDRVIVERAIAEFRSARPVLIEDGEQRVIAIAIDHLDPENVSLDTIADGQAYLVLPPARLRHLGLDREQPGSVALPVLDLWRIEKLALRMGARIDAPVGPVGPLDESALELARLSLVLPAVILVPLTHEIAIDPTVLRVTSAALRGYRTAQAKALKIVSRAPVPLEMAPCAEFVVFRGGEGLRDQVAIVVGQPDVSHPVAVRIHSACLTGDLFGSLKCDCGDQLRGTVRFMAQNGGGVILYLDQEGRGNGIANKIRAYKLQTLGHDTYDADTILGFGADQRRFDFATEMLRLLGITHVRILTNNPEKIEALRQTGFEVVSAQQVLGRPTAENIRYLTAKRDRAGHAIDIKTFGTGAPQTP